MNLSKLILVLIIFLPTIAVGDIKVYNKDQFESLIRRSLFEVDPGLLTDEAVNLILGTAAVESRFGTYLVQMNNGPAKGAFQVEPKTFYWLKEKYERQYPELKKYDFPDLEWNLKAGIIFCRLRYKVDPHPLPNTLWGMANYWKRVYNTRFGSGTVDDFIRSYNFYVDKTQ